jgi:hypothetical protein
MTEAQPTTADFTVHIGAWDWGATITFDEPITSREQLSAAIQQAGVVITRRYFKFRKREKRGKA